MAHKYHADFANQVRKRAGENAGWPFLCDGSPYGCDIFLVGINPAADVPLWKLHWSDEAGVNKKSWLQAYCKDRKFTPTRERIQRIVEAAVPARILETNVYHHYSPREKDLRDDQRGTEVFDFLVAELRPKIVFVHGRSAVRHFQNETSTEFEYGQFTSVRYKNVAFEVFAHRHLSYQCKYEAATELGITLKEHLNTIRRREPR